MDTEMKEMFGMIFVKLDSLDQKVTSLDQKVTKNSIEIDSLKLDIKIIAEVQKAQMEQNERDHEKIIELIDNKLGLHSIILKNLSIDVREILKSQEALERELLDVKRKIV